MNHWVKAKIKKEMVLYCEDKDLEYGFSRGGLPIEIGNAQLEYCIGHTRSVLKFPKHSVLVEGCRRIAHVNLCRIRMGHVQETPEMLRRKQDAIQDWKDFEARHGF